MTRVLRIVLVGALGVALAPALALADETGFADMHDHRREGNRTCMTDHFHTGASTGRPTRKAAEIAAIQDWAGFTAFEYGSTWARYSIAGSREMRCEQDGSAWSCTVSARACRPGGGSVAATKGKDNTASKPRPAPKVRSAAGNAPTAQ
jgi:hypothetical protein